MGRDYQRKVGWAPRNPEKNRGIPQVEEGSSLSLNDAEATDSRSGESMEGKE